MLLNKQKYITCLYTKHDITEFNIKACNLYKDAGTRKSNCNESVNIGNLNYFLVTEVWFSNLRRPTFIHVFDGGKRILVHKISHKWSA